jgi:hypothetical protein
MQAKDIPEKPVLEFIASSSIWCTWVSGYPNSVRNAMPKDTPDKVAIAKMRALIKRGLVDGCTCGCRGDYQITEQGKAFLAGLP